MSGPAFDLRGVVCARGDRRVLAVDHLEVPRGEVLAVVGPNGAGKSTLLHVLALLLEPAAGELRFFGRPVGPGTDRLALRRRTAMVLQDPVLLDMSAIDNVALPLRLRGWSPAGARAAAAGWLERFGVGHLAGRAARSLSGGEAQRVSLARALVTAPEALFLDEPFGSLDWPTKLRLIDDLAAVLRDGGVTAVFVTHDLTEVPRLARRVAILVDGRVRGVVDSREIAAWAFDPAAVLAEGLRWWNEVSRGDSSGAR